LASPKSPDLFQYDFIEEYNPNLLLHSPRQRSMTTVASPTASIPTPIPPPKRQNSIKRMTFKTLKPGSAPSTPASVRIDKNKTIRSPLSMARTPSKEDASATDNDTIEHNNSNNSNGDYCSSHHNTGSAKSMRVKTSDHHSPLITTIFHKTSSPSGHSSLPLFPSPKEMDEITLTKGTSRLIIEGPVFGCPLPELLVKETKISRGEQRIFIPYLVENCVVILMKDEVLKLEGIFRQSGRLTDNQLMKSFFDKGKYVNLDEYSDLYTIAALLKLYLRELPDPLLTINMYSTFLDLGRTVVDGNPAPIAALKEHIKSLPLANKTILKILMALLAKVASLESSNKMSPSNLAIVIAPNIMWTNKHKSTIDVVNDTPAINQLTLMLISHGATLFDEDDSTKNVTLEVLSQQHNSLTIPFPPFAEVAEEEKLKEQQQPKKKNFLEKAISRITS